MDRREAIKKLLGGAVVIALPKGTPVDIDKCDDDILDQLAEKIAEKIADRLSSPKRHFQPMIPPWEERRVTTLPPWPYDNTHTITTTASNTTYPYSASCSLDLEFANGGSCISTTTWDGGWEVMDG